MAYAYYIVESTFPVRIADDRAEKLNPDGAWEPYGDLWDVATNGRKVPENYALDWWKTHPPSAAV